MVPISGLLFVLCMIIASCGHAIESTTAQSFNGYGLECDLAMWKKLDAIDRYISTMANDQLANVKQRLSRVNDEVENEEFDSEMAEEFAYICPDGWLKFNESCYYFGAELVDFPTVVEFCKSLGGYLMQPQTRQENEFIKSFMLTHFNSERPWYWLGVTDQETEGVWKIVGENKIVPFTDWGGSEPYGGRRENCAIFYPPKEFKWADVPCTTHTARPICEKN